MTRTTEETRPTDPFQWVGQTIANRYFIESVAGEGGYGIVYRAEHLALEMPVAVKCLKLPTHVDDRTPTTFLSHLRREARMLLKFSQRHAGIAQAFDMGKETSPAGAITPYMVMEWLDGGTLERFLTERRHAGKSPYALGPTIEILSPAAQALTVAHEEGVSHLDLKPSNLIFTRAGVGQTLKILDFGVAAALANTGTMNKTGKNRAAFSPAYGAPEQFDSSYGATGPATDVFAMALILVEVATGRRVLEGQDLVQLLMASLDAAARTRLDDGGVRVDAVLRKALEPRMERRFSCVGEMWSALMAARHGSTTSRTRQNAPATPNESAAAAEGEHRVCTVLTIDLTWVLARSSIIDAEEIKEALDYCLRTVQDIVEELGGAVESSVGERIVVAFGIPQATDYDAERAVIAALRIVGGLSSAALLRSLRIEVPSPRIGVATGRAFVECSTTSTNPVVRVVGDAVRIARSMEELAPRCAVAMSPETYRRLVGLFNVAPLHSDNAKTPNESPDAYRVLGAVPLRAPITACDFRGLPTRVFGREAERRQLLDALETTLSEGTAHRITLVGPPGIGRSRMLAEFVSMLIHRNETFLLLLGQGSPLAQSTSYGLVATMLRRRFGIREEDSPARARRRLLSGLRLLRRKAHKNRYIREDGEVFGDMATLLDDLEIVVGLKAPRTPIAGASPADDAARTEKTRITASLIRLCRFAARRLPFVVVCDDMQWADDASVDVFEALMSGVEEVPVFIITTARPEMFERRPEKREDTSGLHNIVQLSLLPRRHLEEIVRDRLSRVVDLPADLVNQLVTRAEGNPLMLEEMLHLLLDAGAIDSTRTENWFIRDNYKNALALPATVQGIVHARLDKLGAECRTVLSRAAIVGRTFWGGVVEYLAVVERDETRVNDVLGELRRKQIIKGREPTSLPGEREYMFVESTTHEVVYDIFRSRVRRRLHLQVAQWMEARVRGGDAAAMIAHHYDRGGDVSRALAAYRRAAAYSAALGEHAAAATLLSHASELLRRPIQSVAEGAPGEKEQRLVEFPERIRMELELAAALRRLGQLGESLSACDRARVLADENERRSHSTWDDAERQRWQARIDYNVALVRRVQGQTGEAIACVERAIAIAHEVDIEEEVPPMYALLSFLFRRQVNPDEALRTARRGLRVCRNLPRDLPHRGELVAHLMLGVAAAYYSKRKWFATERCYRQAARAVSESTHPHLAGVGWNGVAGALLGRGEVAAARDVMARSIRLKERAGDQHQIAVAFSNMAEVELRLNRPREALEHAKRAVQIDEKAGARSDLADMYKNVANASLALGDIEAALVAGQRAVILAMSTGRVYLADAVATLERVAAEAEATDAQRWSEAIASARGTIAVHGGDKS